MWPKLVISLLCLWKTSQPNKVWWICMTLPGSWRDAVYDAHDAHMHAHLYTHTPHTVNQLFISPPPQSTLKAGLNSMLVNSPTEG